MWIICWHFYSEGEAFSFEPKTDVDIWLPCDFYMFNTSTHYLDVCRLMDTVLC